MYISKYFEWYIHIYDTIEDRSNNIMYVDVVLMLVKIIDNSSEFVYEICRIILQDNILVYVYLVCI